MESRDPVTRSTRNPAPTNRNHPAHFEPTQAGKRSGLEINSTGRSSGRRGRVTVVMAELFRSVLALAAYAILLVGPFWGGVVTAEALGWGQWAEMAAIVILYYATWLPLLWWVGVDGQKR